ncbi:MAG: hypothetical protein LBL77_02245 [Endomicrobium sp.]|jgi:predicted negative regulator of RcsB-dependent stress response|nr:hypothetical protein [Endomicrobium sp.]
MNLALQKVLVNGKEKLLRIFTKISKSNKLKLFAIVGFFLCVVLIGLSISTFKFQKMNKIASEKLSAAYIAFSQGNQGVVLNLLDEIIANFSKMPSAYQARLIKADIFTELHFYDEALKLLSETIESGVPDTIKPLASVRVIYVYDFKKDYFNAIIASKDFIDKYPNHFLTKDVYLNLAEYYVSLGSNDEALKIFNEILINFPVTQEAEKARNRINEIK